MMKHFRVPGRLALRLEEHDIAVPAVLRKAGLPRDLFEQTRILVSTGELFALWRSIDQVSSDPLIGIKIGIETKTERFHPMAIAALSTENLVAASEHMARYKKLTAPEEIIVQLDEHEFSVSFRWLLAVEAEPPALTDYCFSWMRSLGAPFTFVFFFFEAVSPFRPNGAVCAFSVALSSAVGVGATAAAFDFAFLTLFTAFSCSIVAWL